MFYFSFPNFNFLGVIVILQWWILDKFRMSDFRDFTIHENSNSSYLSRIYCFQETVFSFCKKLRWLFFFLLRCNVTWDFFLQFSCFLNGSKKYFDCRFPSKLHKGSPVTGRSLIPSPCGGALLPLLFGKCHETFIQFSHRRTISGFEQFWSNFLGRTISCHGFRRLFCKYTLLQFIFFSHFSILKVYWCRVY